MRGIDFRTDQVSVSPVEQSTSDAAVFTSLLTDEALQQPPSVKSLDRQLLQVNLVHRAYVDPHLTYLLFRLPILPRPDFFVALGSTHELDAACRAEIVRHDAPVELVRAQRVHRAVREREER